jgi:curved DNA-binding protein CbpA
MHRGRFQSNDRERLAVTGGSLPFCSSTGSDQLPDPKEGKPLTNFIDHYEILGVSPDADADAIKKAYRALIKRHHPDIGGDTEFCALLNEAYAVLSDAQRRAEFDALRHGSQLADEDEAFSAGGWPMSPDVLTGFGLAWTAYATWLSSDKAEGSATYLQLRDALELLTMSTLDTILATDGQSSIDSVLECIASSFPAVVPTEAFVRCMLLGPFASLPAPESIQFPTELDRYYDSFFKGVAFDVPGVGRVSAEMLFLDQSFTYLSYIAMYYPELVSGYVIIAKMRYPKAADHPVYDRLLEAIQEQDLEKALDRWFAWCDGYFSTDRRTRTAYPVMRTVANEVMDAAVVATKVVARETPKVAVGGLFAVLGVLVVIVLGASMLPAAVDGGCGGLFFLLLVVAVGAFFMLGSGFKTGYKLANGDYSDTDGVARSATSGEEGCPHCGAQHPGRGERCQWCHKLLRVSPKNAPSGPPGAHVRQENQEPEHDGELMRRYGITFDGRQYHYGPYRYDKLKYALDYAQSHPE